MIASVLTIDSRILSPVGGARVAPKPDAKHAQKATYPAEDNHLAQADPAQAEVIDNIAADVDKTRDARKSPDRPARAFRQVLREKTEADSPTKVQDTSNSDEPSEVSDPAEPRQVVQARLAENSAPVSQSKDDAATKVEPQAGQELGQLTSALEAEKVPPVTGHAVKSAQIKALLATDEKGQLGLKTVLPENSNGLNGLKVVPPDGSAIASVAGTGPAVDGQTDQAAALSGIRLDTEALTNKADATKDVVSEGPADTGGQTAAANKQPQTTDASADPDPAKAAVPNAAKDVLSGNSAGKDSDQTNADAKAHLSPPPPSAQADIAEKQPQPALGDPPKEVPHARAGVRQTLVKSPDANGKESLETGSDIADASGLAKSDATGIHVSDSQGKNQSRSSSDHGSSRGGEQILSPGNPHVTTISQPATPAGHAKPANLPGQNQSSDVGKQILESMHSAPSQPGAERQITVRLNPPELGRVFIKLQQHETGLTGVLEVSKPQTRFEIEHALPEIIRNLADCGIQVKRFDVVVSEQGRSEHEAFGGQSMPNNGRYDHNPADRQAWSDGTDFGGMSEWSPGSYSSRIFSEPQELLVTDGSINMLI